MVTLQKLQGFASDDVCQVVVLVDVSMPLSLAIDGQGVVVVFRVAHKAGPPVPAWGCAQFAIL